MSNFTSSSTKEDGSMISNLPLLFSDGLPTNLDKMKLDSLESFIPFMLKCSLKSENLKSTPPKWWDPNIPYKIPLDRPKRTYKWMSSLKRLIYKCYTHHGCQFILDFCNTLSTLPVESLNFTKNFDGTTSLYNIPNGKLLVTFRNENRIYDKKFDNSYKNLLPRPKFQENKEQIRPEYDIYLCDNCDEELSSLKDANEHEKICCFQIEHTSEECENPKEDNLSYENQDTFLSYFKLKSNNSQQIVNNPIELESTYKKCKKKQSRNTHFSKYSSIAFSSPLGIMIQKRRNGEECFQHNHIERIDRFCSTKTKNLKTDYSCPVSITFKKKNPQWTHMYKFKRKNNQNQNKTRKDKYSNSKKNTDRLLKECKPLKIILKKLTQDEIDYHTRPKTSNQNRIGPSHTTSPPIIDLCSTDDELDTNHETNTRSKHNFFDKYENTFERKLDQLIPENFLFDNKTEFIENGLKSSYLKQYFETLNENIGQSNQNEKKLDTSDRDMTKKRELREKNIMDNTSQELVLERKIYFY